MLGYGVTMYGRIETRDLPFMSGITRRSCRLGSRCVIAGAMSGPIAASQSGPPAAKVLPCANVVSNASTRRCSWFSARHAALPNAQPRLRRE